MPCFRRIILFINDALLTPINNNFLQKLNTMIDEVGRNIPLFESYNVKKHLRSQVNVNGLKRRKNILKGGLSSLSNYVEKAAFTTICFTSFSMVGVLSCVPVILFGGVWGFFPSPG
jgi:hypothetical protein